MENHRVLERQRGLSEQSVKSKKSRVKWAYANLTAYVLVFPAIVLLFIFHLYPMCMTFFLSLTDWNLIAPDFNWIFADNYTKMLTTSEFWKVVGNTFIFGVFSVGFTVLLATVLAVVLDEKLRGVRLFRSVLFLPYITPMAAIGTLWVWMYSQDFGLINWVLSLFSIPPAPWLAKPGWAMAALVITKIWKVVGYYMVILLAGKQNIADSLYEAGKMDGAGRLQLFKNITMPLLSPYIFFVLIVALIGAFEDFDLLYSMTRGGPAESTNMMIYYIYQHAFDFFDIGYASAAATVLFVILLLITFIQMKVSKRWVHYQ
ncbi:carbohydrate ABC transporter permease [Paenibacillus sp. NPDC056579]|uniref:carbohydrate ABC transporter permease n=1 Tax=Paenibacillus sp. NPDC056579 TaxID=3345871 RepID=UPI003677092A